MMNVSFYLTINTRKLTDLTLSSFIVSKSKNKPNAINQNIKFTNMYPLSLTFPKPKPLLKYKQTSIYNEMRAF